MGKGLVHLSLIVLCIFSSLIQYINADKLTCYHCLQDCILDKAETVKCGEGSSCSRQIKSGAENKDSAIRKCVIVRNSDVACPDGYTCSVCNTDYCNDGHTVKSAGSVILLSVVSGVILKVLLW